MTFLPATERTQFESAVLETPRGCATPDRFTAFEHLVDSWRVTAEIWSDPASARPLLAPIAGAIERRRVATVIGT